MSGGPSTTQTTSSASNPWAPTQPMLQSILSSLGQQPTTPSSAQTGAVNNLQTAANSIPNFGVPSANAITGLLNGGGANNFSPLFQSAFNNESNSLTPIANGSQINPMTNPALQSALNVNQQDITNQVGSTWAGAGMDPASTPGAYQALSRGITQANAPLLAGQYNTNVSNMMNAAGTLNQGANANATNQAGLNQTSLENIIQGMSSAGSLSNLFTNPASTQLSAANAGEALPTSDLGLLTNLLDPIAALGGQSSGTQQTQGSTSLLSNIMGGVMGGAGALGSLFQTPGGAGGSSAVSGMMALLPLLSDERAKEDIKPVGLLHDGSNVYSFRYKADPAHRVHVGLLAQEVERHTPEAVHEVGGVKFVDYGKATERAGALAA